MAIRYYQWKLAKPARRRKDAKLAKKLMSGPKLAKKYNFTAVSGVIQHNNTFIGRLHPDGRGDNLVAHWSTVLTWARDYCKQSRSEAVSPQVELVEPEGVFQLEGLDPTLSLREMLRHCLMDDDKNVDQLEEETGKERKRIMTMLNLHPDDFEKRSSSYRNATWGLRSNLLAGRR